MLCTALPSLEVKSKPPQGHAATIGAPSPGHAATIGAPARTRARTCLQPHTRRCMLCSSLDTFRFYSRPARASVAASSLLWRRSGVAAPASPPRYSWSPGCARQASCCRRAGRLVSYPEGISPLRRCSCVARALLGRRHSVAPALFWLARLRPCSAPRQLACQSYGVAGPRGMKGHMGQPDPIGSPQVIHGVESPKPPGRLQPMGPPPSDALPATGSEGFCLGRGAARRGTLPRRCRWPPATPNSAPSGCAAGRWSMGPLLPWAEVVLLGGKPLLHLVGGGPARSPAAVANES